MKPLKQQANTGYKFLKKWESYTDYEHDLIEALIAAQMQQRAERKAASGPYTDKELSLCACLEKKTYKQSQKIIFQFYDETMNYKYIDTVNCSDKVFKYTIPRAPLEIEKE